MRMRNWYVVLIALAVIAVAWGIGTRIFVAQKSNVLESPLAAVSLAYYKNAKGDPWSIPATGGDQFNVASQETYPRFVLGSVNPVKVSLGDTQTMQIVVRDNVPVVKVWAEVENDKSTDVIPLKLGASSTVSYSTIENQKYLVDSNTGKLVVNDGNHRTPVVVALVQSLFQKAEAEQAVDYSYSGSWVVHDTRTVTYHTTFYALDAQGRTISLTLAWSDPCAWSSGVLQSNCNLAGATDGVDNAPMSIGTSATSLTLNMTSNAILAFNPGQSLTIPSANNKITIDSTSQISKSYLYYTDADGDGYAPNATMSNNSASSWSGHVRVYASKGTNDCNDNDSRANPGNTKWWASAGNSGWASGFTAGDFNCGKESSYPNSAGLVPYNSTYQSSGYPSNYYNGSAWATGIDPWGGDELCYYNTYGYLGSIYSNTEPCGQIFIASGNVFYSASGAYCGGILFGGSAVNVCR